MRLSSVQLDFIFEREYTAPRTSILKTNKKKKKKFFLFTKLLIVSNFSVEFM